MTSIIVRRSRLNGTVRCPSSKSYSHRAIAIASLADQHSTITHALMARDTLATLAGCGALGADIKYGATRMQIKGSDCFNPPENVINAENSGTTIRILIAMSSLVRTGYTVLTGDESLRSRPMQPLLDALRQLGVEAYSTKENGTPPIVIKVRGRLVSKPYVRSTLATMKHFGVSIDHSPDMLEYYIKNARYRGTRFDVPSDFSSAALVLAAGAVAGEKLRVNGLNFEMPQGDSHIIDILKIMGCRIKVDEEKGEVVITGADRLEGGNFNLADTPDLLPVVSILALKATNPVTITGVAHARVKETDRVSNIAAELIKFGAHINEFRDGLKITAPLVIKNASLEAHNDHRLFMAFTIASMM